MQKQRIRTITMTALLAALAYVLAFIEFPVPFSPMPVVKDFFILFTECSQFRQEKSRKPVSRFPARR